VRERKETIPLPPTAPPPLPPAVGGPRLDALFPALSAALLAPRFSAALLGSAAPQLHGALEGGEGHNGDQLYCPQRFATFEDFLVEAEAAWARSMWWDGATLGSTDRALRVRAPHISNCSAAVAPLPPEAQSASIRLARLTKPRHMVSSAALCAAAGKQ
jgi:hypothetical protein